jgi:hypothetical protein
MGICIWNANRIKTLSNQAPERLEQVYGYWDNVLRKDTQAGRGVFVKFVNLPSGTQGEAYAQSVYFRAVYALYPQPVLVTASENVVNKGGDFLKDNSYPSEQWLVEHGVGTVITVGYEPRMDRPVLTVVSVRQLGA